MEELNIYPTAFNGYCPESWLIGKTVRMRLNKDDFFESEETGLQIAIPFPGVQVVILNWRGEGKFRNTASYADEIEQGEFIFEQTSKKFPFCDNTMIEDNEHLKKYLSSL